MFMYFLRLACWRRCRLNGLGYIFTIDVCYDRNTGNCVQVVLASWLDAVSGGSRLRISRFLPFNRLPCPHETSSELYIVLHHCLQQGKSPKWLEVEPGGYPSLIAWNAPSTPLSDMYDVVCSVSARTEAAGRNLPQQTVKRTTFCITMLSCCLD